jgi:hypothetical protein
VAGAFTRRISSWTRSATRWKPDPLDATSAYSDSRNRM